MTPHRMIALHSTVRSLPLPLQSPCWSMIPTQVGEKDGEPRILQTLGFERTARGMVLLMKIQNHSREYLVPHRTHLRQKPLAKFRIRTS